MTHYETMITLFVIIVLTVALSAEAWSSPTSPTTLGGSRLSRRQCLEGVALGTMGFALLPSVALADVTNKVASPTALRSVKRAQKQLDDLKPLAQSSDFTQIKAFLRTPPFSDVRKNCFVIVRGEEDGPKAEELQSAYKAFIASIEKIDSTASLGLRGRKIPSMQLSEEYVLVESTMSAFVKVSEDVALIPGQ